MKKLSLDEEANRLMKMSGLDDSDKALTSAIQEIKAQFSVIQSRSQLLLTLATITLTITGFSGPKIAESGPFARAGMALGLFFVLISILKLITGSLRIRWVTQWIGSDPHQTLVELLHYRDQKTKAYVLETTLLSCGLACYVSGVIAFVLHHQLIQ